VNRPLVVVESAAARDRAAATLTRDGWHRSDGFALTVRSWSAASSRVLCVGDVKDVVDAAAAVLAAARGAALVVRADLDDPVAARLVEDLSRIDVVELEPLGGAELAAEEREVLTLVARGYRVREIAHTLHLSPRSVDRRLARARAALGVETTAQALAAAFGDDASHTLAR